jgi:Fic family protein
MQEKQYQNLTELVLLIEGFYPHIQVKNPYHKLIIKYLPADQRQYWLAEQLTEAQVRLQHLHRYCNSKGAYVAEREDVLAALQLMKPLLRPELLLSSSERELYLFISKKIGRGKIFTRKQLQEMLSQSKSHTHRQLRSLLALELVVKAGGYRNRGYFYQLIR